MNADCLRIVVQENFRNIGMETEMTLQEYVAVELKKYPECFDCFFEKAWDELSVDAREDRVKYITGLFN